MLFGKRREKFILETGNAQTAIQQTLGADFNAVGMEAIIAEADKPAGNDSREHQSKKTNQHKKRYKPQEGRNGGSPSFFKKLLPTIERFKISYTLDQ